MQLRIRSRFWGPCHGAPARAAILVFVALAGCRPPVSSDDVPAGDDSTPADDSTTPPTPPVLIEAVSGPVPDEGFGTSVVLDGDAILVGAPFAGGRVYAVDLFGDGTPVVLLDGAKLEAPTLGASIAGTRARFVAGAPVARRVIDQSGAVALEGEEALGLALAADGELWVAAHGGGWRASDGRSEATKDRPSALALDGTSVVVGFAHGAVAATSGGASIARAPGVNEDGFAVAVLDGLVVHGDPASATVTVGDRTLSGGGRFGAAVAVADVNADGALDLVVGAPMDLDGAGSVALYAGPALDRLASWESDAPGAGFGTSVAAGPGLVVAGAPGAPGSSGYVKILPVD